MLRYAIGIMANKTEIGNGWLIRKFETRQCLWSSYGSAGSEQEMVDRANELALKKFPPSEGWTQHMVHCTVLPQEFCES